MGQRRFSGRSIGIALTAIVVAVATCSTPSVSAAASPTTRNASSARERVTRAAARYGSSRGYHVGVAVLDRQTGQVYSAGDARGPFATESVIKFFIATRLLVSGQMHGETAAMAWKMITRSDDAMASALYGRVGGDRLITWVKRDYHVPRLGTPPARAGWWGSTHVNPVGLVRAYAKIAADHRVAPWLLNAMHHARRYGSDGTYQFFGLPSATKHAAIKQGWGCDYDASCNEADFNSTGFVNGNRYAVALLVRGGIGSYGAPISHVLTGMARTLLPRGVFPAPPPVVSKLGRSLASVRGGALIHLRGANFVRVRAVRFGRVRTTAFRRLSSHRLRVRVPRHAPGSVPIRVVTAYGTSRARRSTRLTFVPPPSVIGISRHLLAAAGGTPLGIRGRDFRDVRAVRVGGVPVRRITVLSPRRLRVAVPPHAAGTASVSVITRFGRSGPAGPVRFVGAPVVGGLDPGAGPVAGTTVTITGSGFRHVRAVRFGRQNGSDLVVDSPTKLTVAAPAHAAGTVALRVVTEFGTSASVDFVYLGRPEITTTALPDGTVGQPYRATLTTSDDRPGTWSVTSGSLPSGLALDGDTISGTPDRVQTSSFTVTFTDSYGQQDSAPLTITIAG